jgi:NADP-dependent 3-hydroxy acid dehydrogenase YdfG
MQELHDKVAVVTGAASGIGRALAHAFARNGMRVVLADVERAALDDAAQSVAATGTQALAVPTDVSRATDVERLARAALDRFGAVHVVCNNAGVAITGPLWSYTLADWQWVLGVNLWGVIHGVRVFTPILLAQGVEAHLVNTASMAGLTCVPNMGMYGASKHAVVAVSETLHHELALLASPVKVSVLCPAVVNTRIRDSARNRPAHLSDTAAAAPRGADVEATARSLLAAGLAPEQVADAVLDAIRAERLYVFPTPDSAARIRTRMDDILAGRNPRPSGPAGFPR